MVKTAFITGAGGYLGGDIARRFGSSGLKVAVCDISPAAAEKTVSDIIANGGIAKAYIADMRSSASVDEAVNAAYADFGRLDIVVDAAGGGERKRAAELINLSDEVIEDVIGVNLFGAIWVSRSAARIMIKQGEGGKIINFSSTVGVQGFKKSVAYAASKGGVMSMTRSLAKELGPHQINVNCIAPGLVLRPDQSDAPALTTNVFKKNALQVI